MSDDFFGGYPDYRSLGDEAYCCAGCRREIRFQMVEYMSKIEGGSFTITHKCECRPEQLFERNYILVHKALGRLLGGLRPVLPYRAAPSKALSLRKEQERALAIFRWECEALLSVAEFELFCARPPL